MALTTAPQHSGQDGREAGHAPNSCCGEDEGAAPHPLDEKDEEKQRDNVHRVHDGEVQEDVALHVGHVEVQPVQAHD